MLARRDDALARLIEHFEGREEETTAGGPDPMADMTPEEKLHYQIVYRKKEGIEEQIDLAVSKRRPGRGAQHRAAAGDEGGRRQVRRRRADPALRLAVGGGDEAGGRPASRRTWSGRKA